MRLHHRGKFDLFGILLWAIILGVIIGVVACVVSNLKAVNDPTNFNNYWNENMYPYRSNLDAADRILDRKDWAAAREAYQEAIAGNAQSQVSRVLHDRIARAWYMEGLDLQNAERYNDAIRTYRSAIEAVHRLGALSAGTAGRSTKPEFQGDITTNAKIEDQMAQSLALEGVRQREAENYEGARDLLEEARDRRPQNYTANVELVQLHRVNQAISPYLQAMRHVLDALPREGSPDYNRYVQDHPEYPQFRAGVANNHTGLQSYILQNYPAQDWVPIVDGLTLTYQYSYFSQEGGESLGAEFDRQMRASSPTAGEVLNDNGEAVYRIFWGQHPNLGPCLMESWTSSLVEYDPITWALLPANPRMGMQIPQSNGMTFTISDLVATEDTESFRLIMTGWHLGPMVLTYGVGRTTITPRGELAPGEYLRRVTYP